MSTLVGPLFSLEASKTLKKTITYQRRVGLPTAYMHTKPTDPFSAGQYAMRAYMGDARTSWNTLSAGQKGQWNLFVKQYCTFP